MSPLAYLLIFTVALEGKSASKEKEGCGDRRSGVFCAVLYHSTAVTPAPGLPCTSSCSCSRINAQAQKLMNELIAARSTDLVTGTGARNPVLPIRLSFFFFSVYVYSLKSSIQIWCVFVVSSFPLKLYRLIRCFGLVIS